MVYVSAFSLVFLATLASAAVTDPNGTLCENDCFNAATVIGADCMGALYSGGTIPNNCLATICPNPVNMSYGVGCQACMAAINNPGSFLTVTTQCLIYRHGGVPSSTGAGAAADPASTGVGTAGTASASTAGTPAGTSGASTSASGATSASTPKSGGSSFSWSGSAALAGAAIVALTI